MHQRIGNLRAAIGLALPLPLVAEESGMPYVMALAEDSASPAEIFGQVVCILVVLAVLLFAGKVMSDREEEEKRRRRADPTYGIGSLRGKVKSLTAKGKKMTSVDRKTVEAHEVEIARLEQKLADKNRASVNVSQTVNIAGRDVTVEAPSEIFPPCEFCGCTRRDEKGSCPGCGAKSA